MDDVDRMIAVDAEQFTSGQHSEATVLNHVGADPRPLVPLNGLAVELGAVELTSCGIAVALQGDDADPPTGGNRGAGREVRQSGVDGASRQAELPEARGAAPVAQSERGLRVVGVGDGAEEQQVGTVDRDQRDRDCIARGRHRLAVEVQHRSDLLQAPRAVRGRHRGGSGADRARKSPIG